MSSAYVHGIVRIFSCLKEVGLELEMSYGLYSLLAGFGCCCHVFYRCYYFFPPMPIQIADLKPVQHAVLEMGLLLV